MAQRAVIGGKDARVDERGDKHLEAEQPVLGHAHLVDAPPVTSAGRVVRHGHVWLPVQPGGEQVERHALPKRQKDDRLADTLGLRARSGPVGAWV